MTTRFVNARALALVLAAGCSAATASADVLISSIDAGEAPTRVLIADDTARIDTGSSTVHMLIDLRAGKMYAVDEAGRYAMDMSSPMPARPEHGELDTGAVPPPAVRFERRGEGPMIAGYATEHYRVSVDGRHCYDEYLAPAALQQPAIRRFIETMSSASHNDERRVLMQLTDPSRLCDAAEDLIDDSYARLGIPLYTQDALGKVIHRVTAIDLHAPHDSAALRVPEGYEVLTRAEVMARTAPAVDAGAVEERRRRLEQHMREFGDPGAAPETDPGTDSGASVH